ncbi:MAG: DUF4337 domain-containing protein [Pseudomonadota bacterium]|nr:DUF4337 domain-containing protein [Pseudomonadota bacterium]
MSEIVESLERHEHAGHLAESGHGMSRATQWTALLVAVLAAGLAIAEQGARHAEIRVQQRAIDATDAWAQYQAKSTRGTVARDVAALASVLDVGADPAGIARRDALVAKLRADADGYDHDPKDGRDAISQRAHDFEHLRDHATEETHAYHNGSASYQLGIVLATASAIMRSRALMLLAAALGVAGVVFSILGYVAPALGAF